MHVHFRSSHSSSSMMLFRSFSEDHHGAKNERASKRTRANQESASKRSRHLWKKELLADLTAEEKEDRRLQRLENKQKQMRICCKSLLQKQDIPHPKHQVIDYRFSGPTPVRTARTFKASGSRLTPSQRLRPRTATAAAKRDAAFETGSWPSVLDITMKAAGTLLRDMRPLQRPGTAQSLCRLLSRRIRGVRCGMLVSPVALAAAMLNMSNCTPELKQVLSPFAHGAFSRSGHHYGPYEHLIAAAAERALAKLRAMGEEQVVSWPWDHFASWLCSQSYAAVSAEPSELVNALQHRGVVIALDGARIGYDEIQLSSLSRQFDAEGCWCLSDLRPIFDGAVRTKSGVYLGRGAVRQQRMRVLIQEGLTKAKLRWKEQALADMGTEPPNSSFLGASFKGSRLIIQSKALDDADGGRAGRFHSTVCAAIRNEIDWRFSVAGLYFRQSLGSLASLERMLACEIVVQRDEECYPTGVLSVSIPAARRTEAQLISSFLQLAFSEGPSFRHPMSSLEAAQVNKNSCQLTKMQTELGVILEVTTSSSDSPSELFGWVLPSNINLLSGLHAAASSFYEACELSKRAVANALQQIIAEEEFYAQAAYNRVLRGEKLVIGST